MSADAFFEHVSRAANGTPYTVRRTTDGFDVALDPGIALGPGVGRGAGALSEGEASASFVHHVTILAGGAYSVTDEYRRRESWRGLSGGGASVERGYGRIKTWRVEKSWERDEHGRIRQVASSRSSSEDGRRLIETAAEQLGLAQRRGTAEKVGLVFAIAGGVMALGALLALAVVFLA